ncbi:hypothetical protein AB6A40_005132 [Gnathostoma spinigerum]|uniref:Large ribosomal subunit protein bL17m n=1 Tax=Gnathostoma spinigerum TaxID=75299 RepID=A0ABD6EEP8_9BILA
MSTQVAATLPRIRAVIGHIPQRLKSPSIPPHRSRLEILRVLVTRAVREERFELTLNRAVETRPYLERILQLAINRERDDPYVQEMLEWWLMESDLHEKLYNVLVPRFRDLQGPFTSIYRLPDQRLPLAIDNRRELWRRYKIGILEIKGNPYPPVVPEPEDYSGNLLNVLLKNALRRKMQNFHQTTDGTMSKVEVKKEL